MRRRLSVQTGTKSATSDSSSSGSNASNEVKHAATTSDVLFPRSRQSSLGSENLMGMARKESQRRWKSFSAETLEQQLGITPRALPAHVPRRSDSAMSPVHPVARKLAQQDASLSRQESDADEPWSEEARFDAALDKNHSDGTSWVIYGELNTFSHCELKFNTRNNRLLPRSDEHAHSVMGRWGVAAINTKGNKGGDLALGQDNFSIARLADGWEVFCVADGHGHGGEWPATHAVRSLPIFLESAVCSEMLENGNIESALTHAFRHVEKYLEYQHKQHKCDLTFTGTTFVCAMRSPTDRNTLWVAHSGDSRAVLVGLDDGVLKYSRDHKPNVPSEKERIEQMGGEVIVDEYDDGFVDHRVVKADTDKPMLGMTRSMGDLFIKEHGVIAEPEVQSWSLQPPEDLYLIMASDGLWEFMTVDEVADFMITRLKGGMHCDQLAAELVGESRELWKENEGDDYCDDITVVLIPLAVGPAPTLTGVGPASENYGFPLSMLSYLNPCQFAPRRAYFCG